VSRAVEVAVGLRHVSRVPSAVSGEAVEVIVIAKLIARTGKPAGQDFTLPDAARIGADSGSEVRIRLEGVSRNHARMYRTARYWLEDAGSTNGTFLNGQRVQRIGCVIST
jgi:pSer/pThr/pTyr-binding forkhead associated (FHA) protein